MMGNRIGVILLMLTAAACQVEAPTVGGRSGPDKDTVAERVDNAAAFLIAHHAARRGDVSMAAENFTDALADDPNNIRLLARSFRALYLDGQIENAAALASKLEQQGHPVSFGSEPIAAISARAGDWAGLEVVARHLNADIASRQLAIVLEAWALAFQEQGDAGLSRLLDLKSVTPEGNPGPPPHIMFSQSAAMLDYLGRSDEAVAAALLALDEPGVSVGAILSMVSVLARNGAMTEAAEIIRTRLSSSFAKARIIADMTAGKSTLMQKPEEDDLMTAAVVATGISDRTALIGALARLRLAAYINPENDLLRYHLGNSLRQINRVEEGLALYRQIPKESPLYQPTMLIMALHRSRVDDDFSAAAGLFDEMLSTDPENAEIWQYYGDAARRDADYQQALQYYDQALALGGDAARLEYKRGITFDNLGQDDATETALRRSIELDQSDAYALNYLGYWLLEHDGDPEEALALIRAAVTAQPRNGFFMDSLGWGYYRLGRYDRAVLFLERAVSLRPVDPVIIDHLGDAYEKVGRLREAVFQWQHALEKSHPDLDHETVRAKIAAAEARLAP